MVSFFWRNLLLPVCVYLYNRSNLIGFNNQIGPILVHIYPLININLHVTYVKQSDKNLLSWNTKYKYGKKTCWALTSNPGVPGAPKCQQMQTSSQWRHMYNKGKQLKQGNSVARDLPRTGSEANTTICVIYILDIDSHCPYLLSGETSFQLTSC